MIGKLYQMKKKILYIAANNLYGYAEMSQSLSFDEIEMSKGHRSCYLDKLEDFLNNLDDSDKGYFLEVDIKLPDNLIEKTKVFPFSSETNKINPDDFTPNMKELKSNTFTQKKVNL